MRVSTAAVAAMIAAMFIASPARAQVPTGTILGTVKDAQGAVVPGASVTATNLGTQFSRNAVTDAAGEYALRLLPVGNYQVEVSIPGFKNFTQTGIVLEVGRNARVDATIELGAVSETVSVVGDSPLVDTTSAALTRTVGQNEVLNLPLVNRDLYQLLSITGGVTSNTSSNSLGGPEQVTMINGSGAAQMGTVNFQLDGGNNTAGLRGTGNPAPNPEAVQEFRVLTNGYSAEYGRYSAGVVDIVTKSGTNVFHGAAFDFIRNEKLNSPRWAPPGTVGTNDPLDRKQFGGAFGGPVAKDKTFFFASYSGLRQEETYYRNTAVVPTALERAGDFSQSSIKPRDPVTGVAFPGNLIPSARFDIAAKTIQDKYVPMSNLPNNFFEVRAADPISTNEGTLKIDHQLSATQSVAFSYFHQRGVDTQPMTLTGNIPWVDRDFAWKQHNVNVSHTWTMGPSMFNQLRGTYVRQFGARVNNPVTSLADLNSKFTPQGDPTLPRLTVSGYFTGQTSIAGPDAGSNYTSVKDALTITKGKHSLKIGGDVSYEAIIHDTLLDNYGVFSFNGSKTGNAYADFLLGLPATMTQDAPVRKTDNGAYFSAFVQDDFRIHPRVTLNLGVRYDVQMPLTDPQDRKLAFVPGQKSTINPTAPVGLLFPGDTGVGRGIVHTDVNNIAPRLGVAWDPNGDGRTGGARVVRHVLRQHLRQRVEHHRRQSAVHRPAVVPDRLHTVRSVPQSTRRRRSVSVQLHARVATVHVAGAGVRSVPGFRLAAQLPDQYHGGKGAWQELQRHRLVRRLVRPEPRVGCRQQLSGVLVDRDDRECEYAAAVSARHDRPGHRAVLDLRQRLQRPAGERGAPGLQADGEGVLLVRPRL